MPRSKFGMKSNPIDPADLRLDRSARPGWVTGDEREAVVGMHVYCTGGMAEVVRVLGRTGKGSRLLQLRLLDRHAAVFHAAASNVLLPPSDDEGPPPPVLPAQSDWIR
jgi:hypothetical protein